MTSLGTYTCVPRLHEATRSDRACARPWIFEQLPHKRRGIGHSRTQIESFHRRIRGMEIRHHLVNIRTSTLQIPSSADRSRQ